MPWSQEHPDNTQIPRRFTLLRSAVERRHSVIAEDPENKILRILLFGNVCRIAVMTLDELRQRLRIQVALGSSFSPASYQERELNRETEFTRLIPDSEAGGACLQAATVFDDGIDPDVAAGAITHDLQIALQVIH